ncbi:MAG: WYL domain-containing protein [Lachnospiraceae bacterium]|nr:WYL domain-containing protein [Lachnospiraceae bacterium]
MARSSNQKLKLLYLVRIFREETDEDHGLSTEEIIGRLNAYGVNADRKTLYSDFEELRTFGFDIISRRTQRNTLYYLGEREFQLAELKLLVDSVQSAKFISDRRSNELIAKLETLASRHQAGQLHRQVVISGRVKTANEKIYYNVDPIHQAISADRQISFRYFQWNLKNEPELRREGKRYTVSPWALLWDDENYYLVGYDAADDAIKHYRVDKMQQVTVTDEPREGRRQFRDFDLPKYTRMHFGMFGGEETHVTLEAENSMAGILIDRFGKDIPLIPCDEEHFRTHVDVAVSGQFLGWIAALGGRVKVTAPETVVERMRALAKSLSEQYGE